MIFVDTGAWVGRYVTGDQFGDLARRFWDELSKQAQPVMTSNLVLAEVGNLLVSRSTARGQFAAQRLRRIYESTAIRVIRPIETDEYEAIDLVEKFSDQKLGLTDAVSMILMRRYNVREVFTFDQHFALAGFQCVPSRRR